MKSLAKSAGRTSSSNRLFCAVILTALSLGFVSAACTRSSTTPKEPPVAGGKLQRQAPDFELEQFEGGKVKLSSLKGTPVVLHFWASWCAPCVEELPQFLETAKEYEGKKLRFVAVNLDKNWTDAHKILPQAKLPANVTSVIDPEQTTPDKLGSYQFPESYLLNSELQIIEKWVGMQDWKGTAVRGAMDRAIAATQ